MIKKAALLLLIMASFPLMTPMLNEAKAQTVEDISKSLICPCGCGMILDSCYCDTATRLKSQIEQKIGEGKTKDQIIADFQAVYGDLIILVTPPKSGLEWTLWTLPIIAAVIGTIAIYQLAQRKASIPDSEVKPPIAETEEEEKEETFEKEEEMKKYEEIFEQEYQKFKKDQQKKE
jgi:cytochrome c-type biogenesis protein CcmH